MNYVGSKLSNRQVKENIIANNLANNYCGFAADVFNLSTLHEPCSESVTDCCRLVCEHYNYGDGLNSAACWKQTHN